MKIILIGYPGSQRIIQASKYLTAKYLPGFIITYLNYTGDTRHWAAYVCQYLSQMDDENIIFSLDDYLVADYIDMGKYRAAESKIGGDIVCVKLCKSTLGEHLEYPVTTQYCIWNREYLMWLLSNVNTPWEFEIHGSRIFNKDVLLCTCMDYFTNSSISSRWEGVRLDGLNEQDIKFLTENGYI